MLCKRKLEKDLAHREKAKEGSSLYDKLVVHVMRGLRGKRLYTPFLVEVIARVGSRPSAGGARGPLSSILTHIGGFGCVRKIKSLCDSVSYGDLHFVKNNLK